MWMAALEENNVQLCFWCVFVFGLTCAKTIKYNTVTPHMIVQYKVKTGEGFGGSIHLKEASPNLTHTQVRSINTVLTLSTNTVQGISEQSK